MNTYQEETTQLQSSKLTSHHWRVLIITIVIIFIACFTTGYVIAQRELGKKQPGLVGPAAPSHEAYWSSVYPGFIGELTINSDKYPIVFLWDTAPIDLLPPSATNLSLSWPPGPNESYRLVAYPFPTDKFKNPVINAISSVFDLVNTFTDQHGFPGFFVNIYNNESWAKALPYAPSEQTDPVWSSSGTAMTVRSSDAAGFPLHQYQWLEVMHACYEVPGYGYPACDDLGYWIYATRGSGIYWNTGKACVGFHKIERGTHLTALMMIWKSFAEYQTTLSANVKASVKFQDIISTPPGFIFHWLVPNDTSAPEQWNKWIATADALWKSVFPISTSIPSVPSFVSSLQEVQKTGRKPSTPAPWKDYWDAAVSAGVTKALAAKGGKDIFAEIFSSIMKEVRHETISPDSIYFFRSMRPSTHPVRKSYYSLIFAMMMVIAALAVTVIASTLKFVRVGSWWVPLFSFLVALALCVWAWFRGFGNLVSSLGWNTLQGAMSEQGLDANEENLTNIWNAFCSPFEFVPYKESTPVRADSYMDGKYSPTGPLMQTFAGMANTWLFDTGLTYFASFLQFDSVIMTAQPNKSGTNTVEMLDVSRVRIDVDASCNTEKGKSICIFWGGLCGQQLCQNYTAEGCTGDPEFFDCKNTLYPFAASDPLPSDIPARGGLCRGFCTSTDPLVMQHSDLDDSLRGPKGPLTPCVCTESKTASCLSCVGNISGNLCLTKTE